MYVQQLSDQLKKKTELNEITAQEATDLRKKWELDENMSLFINRRRAKNPFRIFFEFTDPSSNITIMRYCPGVDPFTLFDFTQAIPNPATRDKAKMDENYLINSY